MSVNTMERWKRLTAGDLLLIFVAGVIGEIVLEILAWFVFPKVLGVPMRPHILVTDVGRSLTCFFSSGCEFRADIMVTDPMAPGGGRAFRGGEMAAPYAVSIHLLLGAVIMPLIYAKGRALLGIRSWFAAALLWGTLLWLIAQSTLAPFAGRPIFLGFIGYSWGSLVAHNVYTVVVAYALERLYARFPELK